MSERVKTPASLCDEHDNGYDRNPATGCWWRIKDGKWFRQLEADYSSCDARIIALLDVVADRTRTPAPAASTENGA
jgi:hypothetical protein